MRFSARRGLIEAKSHTKLTVNEEIIAALIGFRIILYNPWSHD
jgi:hypothetical protein